MHDVPAAFTGDQELWSDFAALCAFGGRRSGTESEAASLEWVATRLKAIQPGQMTRHPTRYTGWSCSKAELLLLPSAQPLEASALLCSGETPPAGLELEVVDCGRGTPDDIRSMGDRIRGRVALVRHDYMFASTTVHRRIKLAAAIEAGAAAFLIAAPAPGLGPVTGSAGMVDGKRRIPALGIAAEAAEKLTTPGVKVRINVAAQFIPHAMTETILLDIPGTGPDRVVLSAHIDGHMPGESALDNASGVALALALARQASPYVAACPRGLTVAIFSAEEWALSGSKEWLAAITEQERQRLVFNLNLDTVVGGTKLTALTSDFPDLGAFLSQAAKSTGLPLGIHEPLMSNSDHANFAALGIPAFRLVSGFNEPDSNCRLLLTKHDQIGLVKKEDFNQPARMAWSILRDVLHQPKETLASLSRRG
jgi:aminopeptidase YwaD